MEKNVVPRFFFHTSQGRKFGRQQKSLTYKVLQPTPSTLPFTNSKLKTLNPSPTINHQNLNSMRLAKNKDQILSKNDQDVGVSPKICRKVTKVKTVEKQFVRDSSDWIVLNRFSESLKLDHKPPPQIKNGDQIMQISQNLPKRISTANRGLRKGTKLLNKHQKCFFSIKSERKTNQNNFCLKIQGCRAPTSEIVDHFRQRQITQGFSCYIGGYKKLK